MNQPSKNKKTRHSFKTPSRFRLSFINENTFNTIWTIRFSRLKVVIAVVIIILAITSMVSMVIMFTPVRTLLPGYLKESQRQQIISSTIRVDSLLASAELNSSYLANLQRILNMSEDSIVPIKSAITDSLLTVDSLLPASAAEKLFVRSFEEQEKFNLKVLSPIAADGVDFFPPVAGAYTTSPREDDAVSVALVCSPGTPVTAVLDGTVIDCHNIFGKGKIAIVQHPNGFMSKYSGMSDLLINAGEKVNAGTPVGLSGNKAENETEKIIFELWHNGTPLNPWDYIPFF